jgi:hypothetical protein
MLVTVEKRTGVPLVDEQEQRRLEQAVAAPTGRHGDTTSAEGPEPMVTHTGGCGCWIGRGQMLIWRWW